MIAVLQITEYHDVLNHIWLVSNNQIKYRFAGVCDSRRLPDMLIEEAVVKTVDEQFACISHWYIAFIRPVYITIIKVTHEQYTMAADFCYELA